MKSFSEAIQTREFTITAELNLARDTSVGEIISQARVLSAHTDAIQVADSPNGRVHITPLGVSNILLRNGIEPLAHLTCRDRNRVALESELLSLGAMGVNSVLLMRGDDLRDDHRPKVKQVFQLRGKHLIEMACALADDPGVPVVQDFCIGTVATVFSPKAGWMPRSLIAKVEAGARFIQTQLCFDVAALRRYMNHLVEAQLTWKAAVIVSVATLPSAVSARWLRENLRGSVVPKRVIRRLEQANDPEAEGVAICSEILQKLGDVPGVSGAHLMTPGDPATIPAAIQAAGLARRPNSAGGT
jgi:methylenetetrahydrofolate reductase (NADPH)